MSAANVRPLLTRSQERLLDEVRGLPASRAHVLSRRFRAIHLRDDMESAGNEGLWRGAQKFSPTFGVSFPAYACACIDHAIFRLLRKEMRQEKLRFGIDVCAAWGAAHVVGRQEDELDPTADDEKAAAKKLAAYLDAKVMSAAATLAVERENAAPDAERSLWMRELAAALREEMATCTERDQRFFAALYGQGATVEEAAAEVGLPYGTAKNRLRKLLSDLRGALHQRGYQSIEPTV
ncbi:MAG: sigma-70 family RNA polymerase sigma factor [Polyangiaceae bacterium]|nr:sigma-70 family RNA polymerase sigma factor [Polyangiaceae bacterium]